MRAPGLVAWQFNMRGPIALPSPGHVRVLHDFQCGATIKKLTIGLALLTLAVCAPARRGGRHGASGGTKGPSRTDIENDTAKFAAQRAKLLRSRRNCYEMRA